MKDQNSWLNLVSENNLPEHLKSYEALAQHFRANLEGLSTTDKGSKFAASVRKLVPQTDAGADFTLPVMNEKKSGDEGVDMTAIGKDGSRKALYVQSKLWLDRAEKIDSVISNFQAYAIAQQSPISNNQLLFTFDNVPPHFLLVTLSPLEGILKKYESRSFASKDFYRTCVAERRINFVDGRQILEILRAAYLKVNELPTSLVLNLETSVVNKDNVFIGIISSKEIQRLYEIVHDALFFENVRDFQGISLGRERLGRTTPNDEIVKTITTAPDKMLERNNGIVFKANDVKVSDDRRQLTLSRGSLVNGCQTTMCLVDFAKEPCYVTVKVVQTADVSVSWDITKAANHQNYVDQIDLDLARNVRPQLVKRAAAMMGVQVDGREKSMFQIIDEIYDQKVAYEETRLLYIGFFSKTPNNLFAANYTELIPNLIESFYKNDPYGTRTFETLFALQGASQEAIEEAQRTFKHPSYADLFERLYSESSLTYRCFISILALCGVININLAERSDGQAEYERMQNIFSEALRVLEVRRKRFMRYYSLAVKVWMDTVTSTEAEDLLIRRDMSKLSRRANFNGMFGKLCREADFDERLLMEEQQFQQQNP